MRADGFVSDYEVYDRVVQSGEGRTGRPFGYAASASPFIRGGLFGHRESGPPGALRACLRELYPSEGEPIAIVADTSGAVSCATIKPVETNIKIPRSSAGLYGQSLRF